MPTAYEIAKAGGRHAAWMQEQLQLGHRQLEAARKSLSRQIDLHKGWIENPQSKVVDWEARPPRYKVGLIKKWQQDISRQAEQVNIIDGVMKEKGYE